MMKVQEAQLKAQDMRLENEKTYKAALGFGLFGVALFLFLLYRRFVVAKEQKSEIEEKNKHITDSIHYAKRIQDAILTSEQDIKEALDDYFIYYQPKDIVSGDFYWVYKINNEKIMLAVADSTGQGVPGGFMGMIGTALLNEIVIENGISDVAEVLKKMQSQLGKTFGKGSLNIPDSDKMVTDKIKISLVCLDKASKKLEFAGAGQTIYYVRNGMLVEEMANKLPLGFDSESEITFLKKELQLDEGDLLYLCTDGIANQVGNDEFNVLLEENSSNPMDEQKEQLRLSYKDNNKTKTLKDDVCMLGVRI
jgi:serine phosphatase RsbU (regulator of sigma subunit)